LHNLMRQHTFCFSHHPEYEVAMKWLQFFRPAKSIDWQTAEKMLSEVKSEKTVLLDVRQLKEYHDGHLAGSTLIPLGELENRLTELDKETPIIVYCAIGGRSRVAAQMLRGKGFEQVYNLTGGIKGTKAPEARGPVEEGLQLFDKEQSIREVIIVGLGLERGLQDFYLKMQQQVKDAIAADLFKKLAEVEVVHQKRLVDLYHTSTGETTDLETLIAEVIEPAMEGGLTTEEYLALYKPNLESVTDIFALAMGIEAQALDLYHRAAEQADNEAASKLLAQLAAEEREHMARLAEYMDKY